MSDLPDIVEQALQRALPHAEMDEEHLRESVRHRLEMWRERVDKVDGHKWAMREASMYYLRLCIVAAARIDGPEVLAALVGECRGDETDEDAQGRLI